MGDNNHIQLSDFASRIECILDDASLKNVWVTAEVNSLNVTPSSGHCYLELIERDPLRGQTTVAIKATIWSSRYKLITQYFEESTGCKLSSGMKILFRCSATYHSLYGLSVNISDIDPAYTIGEAERQRNITIAALKADGVFDMNKELELPLIIQRIAVVSSPTAAGYGDFMHQLESTPFNFQITLFTATMQGKEAENSITQALQEIAEQEDTFDCAVVIRGGGAVTDLQCFDSYIIASYITQMPLPVITGIGHERDISVADLVANTSLKTPTAVAAFIISEAENYYNSLLYLYQKIIDNAQNTIIGQTARNTELSSRISQLATNALAAQDLRITRLSHSISSATNELLNKKNSALNLLTQQLHYTTQHRISSAASKLSHLTELIEARNPRKILSLGYSIVTTADGKSLKKTSQIKIGDTLKIETADAIIDSTVNKKIKK